MNDASKLDINRYQLYSLLERGIIEKLSRGIYRLLDLPELNQQDFTAVAIRIPNAVICLISALSCHGLTTQIPHSVAFLNPLIVSLKANEPAPIEWNKGDCWSWVN